MRILAIDVALRNNGVVILENKSVIFHERFQPEATDFYTPRFLIEHKQHLLSLLLRYKPDLVAIEGSSLASSNWQFAIGELTGVYHLTLYEQHLPVLILPPMKWKKLFTGRGDASKQKIRQVAQQLFTFSPKGKHRVSQDEYDASGIGYIAYLAIKYKAGKITRLPKGWKPILEGKDKGILTDPFLSFNLENLDLSSIKF